MFTIAKITSDHQSINWTPKTKCVRINLPVFREGNVISYEDVFQGNVGSCWFLAALISYLRPNGKSLNDRTSDLVKSITLFREDPNRRIFQVSLHGKKIYVDDYVPPMYHSKVDQIKCMWFILFEKAMLSIMTVEGTRDPSVVSQHENHIWVHDINISHGEMKAATIGISYVVGSKSRYYTLHKIGTTRIMPHITSIDIYNKFKKGEHILANTHMWTYPGKKFPKRESVEAAGAIRTHAYAIIDFQYSPEKKTYLVTIANPWGRNEIAETKGKFVYPPGVSPGKGISIITWERFHHLFACVHTSE